MNINTVAIEVMADEILLSSRPVPIPERGEEAGRFGASASNPWRWQLLALTMLLMIAAPAQAQTVLGPWVPMFDGIDHAVGTNIPSDGGMPDLMVMNALRVDLTDPNLQFYASPRIATDYAVDGCETAGYTTSNFLTMHGLQVAINANYFHDPGTSDTESPSYTDPAGTCFDVIGLEICQGQVVSPQDSDDYTASFMFTTNKQATFFPTNWPANSAAGIYTAVTGLYAILVNGINIGSNYIGNSDFAHQLNPRTAIGLSQDRHYMYLMVIDGRQSGYSDGAFDWETAIWLQLLGATDGANMDGGGSTCMVIQNSAGAPVELNHDSASAADGVERTVGSHLGIYAKPVPGFINNVTALPDDTAATITWTTASDATTQVQYGLTTNFNLSSALLTALVTNHAALLTGLTPDTGYYYAAYSQAGATLYVSSNFFFTTTNYVTPDSLFDLTNTWDYTTNDLDGINWTATNYDDSAWIGSGPGLLWTYAGGNLDIPFLETIMPLNPDTGFPYITYYFRTHFSYTNSLSGVSLLFTNYVDDGAVFYLNGAEIYRLRMPAAPAVIYNSTLATNYPCDGYATCPDLFTISGDSATNLVVGDNVLAVEVHLDNVLAETITFGSSLVSTVPLAFPPHLGILISNQSITLHWSRGGFILQQADTLPGPWTDVPGPVVSSPFIWTNSESSQFFRLWR
jgi:hypothetical protein